MDPIELEVGDYPDKLNRPWPKSLYSNLHRSKILEGHNGCVNSVSWHPDGQLLATGSDDLNLGLWSYPEGGLISLTRTDHDDNIFASTWLDRNRIVSGARDGLVGLFEMTPDGTLVNTKMYNCLEGAAMRIATDPLNTNVFLSCSRDGSVIQYDTRVPHQCSSENCNNVLICSDIDQIGWHSISISPVRSEFLALGGDESFPMIYDRRMLSNTARSSSGLPRGNFEKNVVSWIPSPDKCAKLAISSVCFSPKTMDLAVSYNSGPIFLANTLDQTGYDKNLHDRDPFYGPNVFAETFQVAEKVSEYIRDGGDPGPDIVKELLRDAGRNLSFGRIGPFRRLAALETFNAAIIEFNTTSATRRNWAKIRKLLGESIGMFDNNPPHEAIKTLRKLARDDVRVEYFAELFKNAEIDDEIEELPRGVFDLTSSEALALLKSEHYKNGNLYNTTKTNVLALGYHNIYSSHANHETIKDVSFVGTQGEFIGTGSDLGYFFIYDARTGEPVFIGKGDEIVTNVVQSHPTLPVIATSGIEHSVKIWEPSLVKEGPKLDYNEITSEIASRARRPSVSCYVQ